MKYLPEPMDGVPQLEDPSDMKKEQIGRLLEHWRRPVAGSDLFRFSCVLVNSKTEETTRALYKDSFATLIPIEAVADWDTDYNNLQEESNATAPPLPQHQSPLSVAISPSTISDSNIDPALLALSTTPPQIVNTSPVGLTTEQEQLWPPRSSQVGSMTEPEQPRPARPRPVGLGTEPVQPQSPRPRSAGLVTEPMQPLSPRPVGSVTEREQPVPPRPKPLRKSKTKNPTDPTQDLNPTAQQEEELGRPKRILKRKGDIYLEAEEKAAKKAKQGSKPPRKKR